jgi:hypothetical protein
MAKNVKVRVGNATVEASPELNNLVNDLLEKALPETRRAIDHAIDQVLSDARRDWPIRTTRPTRQQLEGGESFQPEISPQSKRSIDRFESGVIIEGENILGYVANTAPYAWAIRAGRYSLTDVDVGKRVANELMFKPIKKQGDIVAEALAKDLMRGVKR